MKLYTKQGDLGETSLVGGDRVMKDDVRISVCGDLDELNAHIGMLQTLGVPADENKLLSHIQELLFHAGGELSNPTFNMKSHIEPTDIAMLEQQIDALQQSTPDPCTFVLPGGCLSASQAHICRTVARRAERSIVTLSRGQRVDPLIIQFLNRLSDYFFALALNLNFIASVDEKKLYISCK